MTMIRWFHDIGIGDVEEVGGKNASLGEMYRELSDQGVTVPNGFATSSNAYRLFLRLNGLDRVIEHTLDGWVRDDVDDLARRTKAIRSAMLAGDLPPELKNDVSAAYQELSRGVNVDSVDVAVRSSATAEDLPEASFAGQQETFLMVHGEAAVFDAIRACFASLYTSRAVSYRSDMGIDPSDVALSASVQHMVRADLASSGVMFTLDTDSGFRDVVYVTSTWGLGENIVQGRVIPDAFYVHKPRLRDGFVPLVGRALGPKEMVMTYDRANNRVVNAPTSEEDRRRFSVSDEDVLQLARWALIIEDHYTAVHGRPMPMDIEWAKDGITGDLFIVQARPETVHSQAAPGQVSTVHRLNETGVALVTGHAVGQRIAAGAIRHIERTEDMAQLQPGEVLATEITDPDWEPILKRASALVTERGGRTSHAAIIARELDIPAIVGVGDFAGRLQNGHDVTVSCADGEVGTVYDGRLDFEVEETDYSQLAEHRTTIMLNVGDPSVAFKHAQLPSGGVGLARMEFIFASHVGVHPLALIHPEVLSSADRQAVLDLTFGYEQPADFLVDRLAQGVGTLAAAFWPRPVILRFSDFKSNEYANLMGGSGFEPVEPNPMIGWRGASRYYDPNFREGFELEIKAVRRVREDFGLTNLAVMIPFCRTPDEGRRVLEVLREGGLVRGENDLEVYVMGEIPSNVFRAAEFAELFDGISIGSNDLTQLTLGIDRDSEAVASLFDERDPAVLAACSMLIKAGQGAGAKVGICGQAPSDYPEFAAFLVEQGIDSISVTPDSLARTIQVVAAAEANLANGNPD